MKKLGYVFVLALGIIFSRPLTPWAQVKVPENGVVRAYHTNGKLRMLWTKKSGMLINYNQNGKVQAAIKSKGMAIEAR